MAEASDALFPPTFLQRLEYLRIVSRRAFAGRRRRKASLHVVEIARGSRTHYHKRLTEIYFVLKGRGRMEADGRTIALRPMTAVLLEPGCRHRAVGNLRILNVVIPGFDPRDEWFD